MKKKRLQNCRLYVIIDEKAAGNKDLVNIAKNAINGGADIIQLRLRFVGANNYSPLLTKQILKIAKQIKALADKSGCLFIINDRVDIAYAAGADGAHLGQDDLPAEKARKILGPDKIIGLSTHSLSQAIAAQKLPVDYISVGPVFSTPTKPQYKAVGLELVKKAGSRTKMPFFAIGGINRKNIDEVIASGAARVAVVRAVIAADDVKRATSSLRGVLTKSARRSNLRAEIACLTAVRLRPHFP